MFTCVLWLCGSLCPPFSISPQTNCSLGLASPNSKYSIPEGIVDYLEQIRIQKERCPQYGTPSMLRKPQWMYGNMCRHPQRLNVMPWCDNVLSTTTNSNERYPQSPSLWIWLPVRIQNMRCWQRKPRSVYIQLNPNVLLALLPTFEYMKNAECWLLNENL